MTEDRKQAYIDRLKNHTSILSRMDDADQEYAGAKSLPGWMNDAFFDIQMNLIEKGLLLGDHALLNASLGHNSSSLICSFVVQAYLAGVADAQRDDFIWGGKAEIDWDNLL